MEHIIPVAAGGPSTRDNLVGACDSCNNLKDAFWIDHLDFLPWFWDGQPGHEGQCCFQRPNIKPGDLYFYNARVRQRLT